MTDTTHTEFPVCPHCGHEHLDAWEWDLGPGIDGEGEHDCGACERPFFVTRHAHITYTTKPEN